MVSAHLRRMRSCSSGKGVRRAGAGAFWGKSAERAVRSRVGTSAGSNTCVWTAWESNLQQVGQSKSQPPGNLLFFPSPRQRPPSGSRKKKHPNRAIICKTEIERQTKRKRKKRKIIDAKKRDLGNGPKRTEDRLGCLCRLVSPLPRVTDQRWLRRHATLSTAAKCEKSIQQDCEGKAET